MKIFSIAGWSGSGKTMLITRLIESFKGKKRRVIAVKKAHRDCTLQPEAKDTAKFLHAGADEVYLLAKDELLRMTALNDDERFLAGLKMNLRAGDIVLMEGLFQEGIPVIEVAGGRQPLKFPPAKLAAVVSDQPGPSGPPRFHPDRIDEITAFMEGYHGQRH
jgi:molybdopterin-guanine dinucleotide biosynthesis adapter protein